MPCTDEHTNYYWTNGPYVVYGAIVRTKKIRPKRRDYNLHAVCVRSCSDVVYHVGQKITCPLYHTPESHSPQWRIVKEEDLFIPQKACKQDEQITSNN